MKWLSTAEAAQKWGIAEQTIRRYCRNGLIPDAVQAKRSWLLPYSSKCPVKSCHYIESAPPLLGKLIKQKNTRVKGLYNYMFFHPFKLNFSNPFYWVMNKKTP